MKHKKINKKIKRLLVMIFITSIYLSTAAYSWFSTNRTVYISELSIKVKAQGGIEISTDAKDWKTYLTQEDILKANETYTQSVNQLPMTMEPVSTGKEVLNGKLQMYYGYTENDEKDYILLADKNEESEANEDGKFMVFDIFLKADNAEDLYLAPTSGAFYKGITPGIENSIRFAFLVEGNVSDSQNVTGAQNLLNATSDTTYIWEPNYDTHSENGIRNAKQVYGLDVSSSNSSQVVYDGLINEITKEDKVYVSKANQNTYPNLFRRVNIDYLTKSNFEQNVKVFSIKPGINKVRVYIWMEGQDVDCEDKSAIGDVEFNFQFTTNPA